MRKQKTIAAVAMTAALAGGALIGSTLGNPLASGAQDNPSTTTTAPSSSTDPGAKPNGDRGPRGGGLDLEVAAKTLGLTTEELRTQLQDGKSLADVAKAQGVDKQKLIDALVAAGEQRLDEAKAALPDRVAEAVEATHTPGEGGWGRGGHGPGDRGANLETAAKALGISEDDLRTALRDGKTIAEVAKDQGVDVQKVIDALVAEAKTKTAAAVKDGKITQAEADKRLENLTERITSFVNDGFKGGPGGPGRGDHDGPPADGENPPAEGSTTTTTPSFGGNTGGN
ncbi:MAG: hypothetical protein ACTHN0_15625 [Aquihabitans sp.]